MDSMNKTKTTEQQLRIDLAAAFRLAAKFDWQEAVANNFSLAVSDDGKKFLMNARWTPFETLRASELVLLDSAHPNPRYIPLSIKPPGRSIARCMLICPTCAACCMCTRLTPPRSPAWPTRVCCRWTRPRRAISTKSRSIPPLAEWPIMLPRGSAGAALGDKKILMMRNHGVMTVGETVAEAFDAMYHVERGAAR